MDLAAYSIQQFEIWVLVLLRMLGFMINAPFLGGGVIPPLVRVSLAALMAFAVFPLVQAGAEGSSGGASPPAQLGAFLVAGFCEGVLGWLVGFTANLVFAGIQIAGLFVGQQIGIAIADVIDPVSQEQDTLIGQFKYLFALLLFFGLNGHHIVLRALVETYRVVPLLGFQYREAVLQYIGFDEFARMFEIALRISAPCMVALLLVTVAMALLARTVPEINIFIVGFALRVGVGLLVLALSIPVVGWFYLRLFERLDEDLQVLVHALG